MINFAFAIPTRNSIKTARQALLSMAGQSHADWRAVVVDDCSTDGTPEFIEACAKQLGITDRVTVLRNRQRAWEVSNVLRALSFIEDDEIVCRLDLDDYLCDLNALEIMAKAYEQNPGLEAAWSKHRWLQSSGVTNFNISQVMPADADPYRYQWVSSHLKTWRRSVSRQVADANYRGQDGSYIKRAGDQAIYLPVLKLAKRRVHVPVVMYAYRCEMSQETFSSDDARFQKEEAEFLRNRGLIVATPGDVERHAELTIKKLSSTLWREEELELAELTRLVTVNTEGLNQ